MANKKMSEGVGKKIVEALKKQSEIEINPLPAGDSQDEFEDLTNELSEAFESENETSEEIFEESNFLDDLASEDDLSSLAATEPKTQSKETISIKPSAHIPSPSFGYSQAPAPAIHDNFIAELDTFEIPSNIAVLKKLIAQLPSGVTRHTGAQIIKQTMEALGISMKSVLQEAQQVQEGLNNSAKECHSTIQEYKKQIMVLEKQAQNHQKQYAALNELISLFVQTGV